MTWTIYLSGTSGANDFQEAPGWPIFTANASYVEGAKSYSQTFAEAQNLEQAYRLICGWLEACKADTLLPPPESSER